MIRKFIDKDGKIYLLNDVNEHGKRVNGLFYEGKYVFRKYSKLNRVFQNIFRIIINFFSKLQNKLYLMK